MSDQPVNTDPFAVLLRGREILDPLLSAHGFTFVADATPPDPEDEHPPARGAYVRDDRRLELSVRRTLGQALYRAGGTAVTHDAYMNAVLGAPASNQFPSFSADPMDGFRHLRHDIENYAIVFLRGRDEHFRRIAALAAQSHGADALGTLYRR